MRREFCPLPDIQEALNAHRYLCEAERLLLISFDQGSVLRTLTFESTKDTVGQPSGAIPSRGRDLRRAKPPNPLWGTVTQGNLVATLKDLDQHRHNVPGASVLLDEFLRDELLSADWQLLAPFEPQTSATISCLILRLGGTPTESDAEFVAAASERVNATANASVHRDARVSSLVRQSLLRVAQGHEGRADPQGELLRLAMSVASSNGAALYIVDRAGPGGPVLVKDQVVSGPGVHVRAPRLPATATPPTGEGTAMTLATAAYVQRRPQLLQSAHPSTTSLVPTFSDDNDTPLTEMAVPVPVGLGAGTSANSGVLILCRIGDGEQPYGDYELALVRNVALRIALLRATQSMAEASRGVIATVSGIALSDPTRSTTRLGGRADRATRHALQPDPAHFEGTNPSQDNPQAERDAGPTDPNRAVVHTFRDTLPVDFSRAVSLAAPIVQFAGEVTGSHSATLRLLAPNPHDAEARQLLSRVVAWPGSRYTEEATKIPLDAEHSVNAWVARTGRPAYVTNLRQKNPYSGMPGLRKGIDITGRDSVSELCVPIKVDNRLVGTMNLESPTSFGYELLEDVVGAAAAQISLLIASIRREYLREVLSIGSDVQNSAHELSKLRRSLERTTPEGNLLEDVKAVLDGVIGSLNPTLGDSRDWEPDETVLRTVQNAADDAGVEVFVNAATDVSVHWTSRFRRRFYLAMSELLRNSSTYGWLGSSGLPLVKLRRYENGGRDYVDLLVSHRYRPGSEPNPTTVYREPVRHADGLHFGAYTAGAIMRSLGGDIAAVRLERTSELVLVVSIPVEETA